MITERDYKNLELENAKLKRMLLDLFDAHYGVAYHQCGDGDGLTEAEAKRIVSFVKAHHEKDKPIICPGCQDGYDMHPDGIHHVTARGKLFECKIAAIGAKQP